MRRSSTRPSRTPPARPPRRCSAPTARASAAILASNKVSSLADATIDRLQRRRRGRRHGRGLRRRRDLGQRQGRLLVDHDEQRRRERPPGRDQQLRPAPTSSAPRARKTLAFGDRVRLANDFGTPFATTGDLGVQEVNLNLGQVVELHGGYGAARLTTASGIRLLRLGDNVAVEDGYEGGGDAGVVYRYVGPNARLDLGEQDFRDAAKWKPLGGNPGSVYRYLGLTPATFDLNSTDFSERRALARARRHARQRLRVDGPDDLRRPELAGRIRTRDLGWWKPVPITRARPAGLQLHEVPLGRRRRAHRPERRAQRRRGVDRRARASPAASIAVVALEQAVIRALADSTVSSSGGSSWNGQGSSLAVNAVITTNRILSGARAFIDDEHDRDDRRRPDRRRAEPLRQVDATTLAATSSGNQVGRHPARVQHDRLEPDERALRRGRRAARRPAHLRGVRRREPGRDARLRHEHEPDGRRRAHRLGADGRADRRARLEHRDLGAGRDVRRRRHERQLHPRQQHGLERRAAPTSRTSPARCRRATSRSRPRTTPSITADTKMYAEVSPTNDAGAGILNTFAGQLADEYQFTSNSGTQAARLRATGARRRRPRRRATSPGSSTSGWARRRRRDLGAEDYTDFELWKELTPTNLITGSLTYAVLGEIGTRLDKERRRRQLVEPTSGSSTTTTCGASSRRTSTTSTWTRPRSP